MPDEVDQLCARLTGVTRETYAGVEYHQGKLGDKEVVVCCAGHGQGQRRLHGAGAHHPVRGGAADLLPALRAT